VDDQQMVVALQAGDTAGLTSVHDAYAARLYDYAYGMLRDREAAEDAVHDALLVAAGRAGSLRDPQRLATWLYALTRNECLRQARRSRVASQPRRIDSRDQTMYFGAADLKAEQARAWIRDAAAGMQPERREALDLTVRHGLSEPDVATVLGLPAKRAAERVAAARDDLDHALDSLLIARAGHGECAELDALLAGWDGRFNQSVHERVSGHTASCATCAAGASARGGAADRFAELPPAAAPTQLLNRLLATAAVPDRVSYRGDIAEPFLRSGFPVPLDGSRRRRLVNWAAAVVVVLLLVGGLWYTLHSESAPGRGAGVAPPGILPAATSASPSAASLSSSPSVSPSASPSVSASVSPSASPSRSATPPPRAPIRNAAVGTRVDALLADSTVGCVERWQATVTTYVRGGEAREVTFRWGEGGKPSHPAAMRKLNDSVYQANVDGLPMDVPIAWQVVAVLDTGQTATTDISSTQHRRQC
jgi:RNA polymerase sigma factor (sigma-70 family)